MCCLKNLIIVVFTMQLCSAVSANELSQERQQELRHLLLHDCGSCHGMTLKGGLGPALTSHDLKEKEFEFLVTTVAYGRPGTPMPPFKGILTDADIHWLVSYLKKGDLP